MYSLNKAIGVVFQGVAEHYRHESQFVHHTVTWYLRMYKDGERILGGYSSAISLKLTAYNISHVTIAVDVWAILSEFESKSVKLFNSRDRLRYHQQ